MATAVRNGVLALLAAVALLAIGTTVAFVGGGVLAARDGAAERAVESSDPALTWIARVLLLLSVAWLVIGMLSARTRMVRRPGAAGARAAWLASTRPWRARESTLGMLPLDRWLMILVPGGLLIATRAVQTALLGWIDLAVVLSGWLVFIVVVRLLVGKRSPWPVIAAVGGVLVLRCALALAAVSVAGPAAFWVAFWTDPVVRAAYVIPAVALALWLFVAAGWALVAQFGPWRAWGIVVAGVGAGLALPGAVIAAAGVDAVTEAWGGQLPGARPELDELFGAAGAGAWAAVGAGLVLLVVGILLRFTLPRGSDTAIH
jgi:hypothetical protein